MKTVLIALVSALSFSAFAGPEEHIAAQVCYVLAEGSQPAVANTPQQICLEEATLNLENSSINVYSYFTPALYKDLSVNYLARRNENGFRFRSSAVVQKAGGSMCDFSEESVLNISGISDNDGIVEITFLDITVAQTVTPDNCHSRPQTTILKYVLQ